MNNLQTEHTLPTDETTWYLWHVETFNPEYKSVYYRFPTSEEAQARSLWLTFPDIAEKIFSPTSTVKFVFCGRTNAPQNPETSWAVEDGTDVERVWYLGATDDTRNEIMDGVDLKTEPLPTLPEWLLCYTIRGEEFETIVTGHDPADAIVGFLVDADPDTVIDAVIRSAYKDEDGTFKPRTGSKFVKPQKKGEGNELPDELLLTNRTLIRGALVLIKMMKDDFYTSAFTKTANSLHSIVHHSMQSALDGYSLNRNADNTPYSYANEAADLFDYMVSGDNGTWQTAQLVGEARNFADDLVAF